MAKGKSSGTRTQGAGASSESRSFGGGKGIASGNTFRANEKIYNFEGGTSLDGGYFSLMTKDGKYSMVIETTNGYNDELGVNGTTIEVGIRKGTGKVERLTTSFVEQGSTFTESMGLTYYNNVMVAQRINNSMPYYAELANKWIKKNK